ncbi:uncharacterized protein M421DRAFT_212368 [Didymella exigua CBS 183.55]|uniref:Uncharacterized protein n=1 Tax=Didymella exigua CBS 183.55 TaxID=1150837 RepID=A0A6A5RFX2_9PLEO|nr:uncharacterized protein M421DRAFT_212368 [Didymella exigua CBS 183.55]KAF1926652.1 hypothetical protein M421DRAFT_212368 [Didymella exigua CBS 183.55]
MEPVHRFQQDRFRALNYAIRSPNATAKRRKFPTTNVSFAEHSANILKLIRDTHTVTNPGATILAREKLQNYTLLSSIARIYGRLIRGKEARNFFEHISVRVYYY